MPRLFSILVCIWVSVALADEATYGLDDYVRKSWSDRMNLQLLGSDALGDVVDPATYNVRFVNTDIYLDGNGPSIAITRSFDVAGHMPTRWRHLEGFADWKLEVPRIETTAILDSSGADIVNQIEVQLDPALHWMVAGATPQEGSSARCSGFNLPPTNVSGNGNLNRLWWPGVTLQIPGRGAQKLLVRATENTNHPNSTGVSGVSSNYPLVTSENWQVACLTSVKNGLNGEGFFVIDPNGTKYWFDWIRIYNPHAYQDYWEPVGNPDQGISVYATLANAELVATRIEDRFGNYVTYTYSGKNLTDINGSDGRHVKVKWKSQALKIGSSSNIATIDYIDSITLQPESENPSTYRYEYALLSDAFSSKWEEYGIELSKVTLPDGSDWEYSLHDLNNSCAYKNQSDPESFCRPYINDYQTLKLTGTVKGPSGVTGIFTFVPYRHQRDYNYSGREDSLSEISTEYDDPAEFDVPHIIEKQLVGAGLNNTWKFRNPQTPYYLTATPSAGPGGSFRVERPDGTVLVKDVNLLWRHRHEGKVLNETIYADKTLSRVLSTTQYTYADVNEGPYPSSLGDGVSFYVTPRQQAMMWPKVSTQITQDGRIFATSVAADCAGVPYCFDAYGRPTKIVRSNKLSE